MGDDMDCNALASLQIATAISAALLSNVSLTDDWLRCFALGPGTVLSDVLFCFGAWHGPLMSRLLRCPAFCCSRAWHGPLIS